MSNEVTLLTESQLAAAEQKFTTVCCQALDLKLAENAGAAFRAVTLVNALRDVLSDPVMHQVFMPLMNTAVGFLTDKDPNREVKGKDGSRYRPNPYPVETVRDCLIDAVMKGVLPTGNQFNIISGRMYITNEGYSYLLKKLKVRHLITKTLEPAAPGAKFVNVVCKIAYSKDGEEGKTFTINVQCKFDDFSSPDQIKGKADRKAKKTLYEYVTGEDIRDGDVVSADEDLAVDEQAQPETTAQRVEQQRAAMRNNQQPDNDNLWK